MLLSRSISSASGRKDQKFRNKFKGKKKQKRLDAICEKAYNRSHIAVQKVESSEINEGDHELELRRSCRARRAPVFLDSSPLPPKKRQKVDGRVPNSAVKTGRDNRRQCQAQCSSSRDLQTLNGLWGPRLRSREKNPAGSGWKRGESSPKGKRKLYDVSDDDKDDMDPQCSREKEGLASEKTTVVKSKRPGRIKASNILINENQEVDLGGRVEANDDDQGENEVFEVRDEIDGLHLEVNLECEREVKAEDVHMASSLDEKDEAAVQRDSELEKCQNNGNVESNIEHDGTEILACDVVPGEINSTDINCAIDDDRGNDRHAHSPLENEMLEKEGTHNHIAVVERKPRIKIGRHCGLCWGGTDGKPPKILTLEGASSDEAYTGSSESEEPNYDVWDGFGDQSGWLGRLLGPINDRFGIAGIWVHQQCAVWSPEVYFAGLGCLKNVRAALYRGRVLKCSRCRRPGATIGCRVDRCPKTYHLPCARAKGCIFDHRKFLIVCTDHRHLFQPHGIQNAQRLKKLKAKKLKLELRKIANDASQKDIEAEEKWLDNCGEDEEFLKREGKRLHRDLWRVAPTYIGGANPEQETKYQGWESVAGLQDVIQCMKEVVILPLLYPEFFNNLGITPPRGVLLHGHPGTGKTLVVRALVGSCARGDRRIAYFARKGADCLGKYVGDAERQLRLLFQVAEKSQPSIIFFDEIDGLAPCRSRRQDQTHNSVVSTLLALMDGLKSRGSVIVIGATNRPDAVDPALRRPGRFDREIYFPLPSGKDREAILSLHTQKWPKPLTGYLLKWVAKQTVGFAGADLQALCTQAAIIALRRSFPLQEVLLAAESRADKSMYPAIPAFAVEERDWLKALSCAAPPCSRRESGIAVNDVITSPLEVHLVPYLLQPLIRLVICLFLDENVWLPPHLAKASTLVKNVIVSILDRRGVQSDIWWLHMDGLLEETDVINEIEKTIFTENVLVGGKSSGENFVAIDRNVSEDFSDVIPCSTHSMGVCPGLLSKMPHRLCSKSGYQVLICGYSKSGQQHLASCLLHFFIGNIDVWKVDLASIAHEGHGDMVQGLTRILAVGCARASVCMLYMPTIDLWAIETYDSTSEDCEPSLPNPQSSGKICCDVHCGGGMECGAFSSAEEDVAQGKPAVNKASYLWTSFVEQVESMRVNSCMIIMATSELPFSSLPSRIRQFFGNGMVNCGLSSSLDRKVPQYSLQLDGQFDNDKVIHHFAAKLSKDLVRHFVQSLHGQCHVHEKLFEEKNFEIAEDVDQVCKSKSDHVSPQNLDGLMNKSIRVKSSLLLAISAVGYQILSYPHFAELCWVTSKLKEGPCADVGGPWKGWPFNSCIVRPCNSTEKGSAAPGSVNIKDRESGLVRGLVAVGLEAYRGKYPSLREVCSEVRKVLETLVRRIDEKIHTGKDKTQFIRILSQVAYLDDMVLSWAQGLQSLEMDTRVLEANPRAGDHKTCVATGLHQYEALGKGTEESDAKGDVHFDPTNGPHVHPNTASEIAVTVKEPSNRENKAHEVDAKDAGCADPINTGNQGQDGSDDAITLERSSHQVASGGFQSLNHMTALNEVILERSQAESDGGGAALGHDLYSKLPNDFTQESSNIAAGNSLNYQGMDVTEVRLDRPNGMSLTDSSTLSKVSDENYGGSDLNVDYQANPGCLTGSPVDICFYQCCSKCSVNLCNLVLRIIKKEWGPNRANSTVEEAYDFLASLSANLHSSLSQSRISCKHRKSCYCLGTDLVECEKLLAKECRCHAVSKKTSSRGGLAQISGGIIDWQFILNDGVVSSSSTLEAGTDVCYHCKFEKLCLSSLIEWLVMSKDMSLD